MAESDKPVEEDIRHDDQEYNPAVEPKKRQGVAQPADRRARTRSRAGTTTATTSTSSTPTSSGLPTWRATKNSRCSGPTARSSSPAIYAKPPVPVVVPKFKDRRPVYQAASEVLERCAIVAFDLAAHRRPDEAGARRPRADRPRRGVVSLRERQGRRLLQAREGLHRLQEPPRLPALASPATGAR